MKTKSDSQILRDVLNELRWDHRIGEAEVGVEVDNGIVTLSGTVPTYAKKLAAREAAHRVEGVLDVANDVAVVPPASSKVTDTDIASAVRHALKWDTLVPDEEIQSTVADGWVTLEGTVGSISQRKDAEMAIRYLKGVRGVSNLVVVKKSSINPERVKKSIEDALARRAEREAKGIDVMVNDGSVTLSGNVFSWREKKAAVGAASEALGIQNVVDNLRINLNV
jgi:osmotically-inducible protein OsmY